MKLNITKLGKVAITVDDKPWNQAKAYDRLVIVYVATEGICYISRQPVPKNTPIDNRTYWIPMGPKGTQVSFADFTVLVSEHLLPTSHEDYAGPYLIDGVAYFWVGENGNVGDGLYEKVNIEGEKGDDGLSAYQIWIKNGGDPTVDEATWLTTYVKGKQGETGPKGDAFTYDDFTNEQLESLKGPKGETGATGARGPIGPQGATGPQGPTGADGHSPVITIGADGCWAIDGVSTGQKAQGPQGPAGSGGTGTSVYVADNKIHVVVGGVSNRAVLESPPEHGQTLTLKRSGTNPYVTFHVKGNNLTGNIVVTLSDITRKFKLRLNGTTTYNTTFTINAEDAMTNEGVSVDVVLYNAGESDYARPLSCTVTVSSDDQSITDRYVNVSYKPNSLNPTFNS